VNSNILNVAIPNEQVTHLKGTSFSNRVSDTWNSLPSSVIDAPSLNAFKSRLNTHWINNPIKWRNRRPKHAFRRLNLTVALKAILRNIQPIMLNYPSADRNKEPILKVLQDNIPADTSGLVLEVASGSGQHVAHFSKYFKNLKWQPSEVEDNCLKSIVAYTTENELQNVLPPLKIDITQPIETWNCKDLTKESCDIMYNANMVHISPWSTSVV
ncbi:hypothetical protein KUTeg_003120, partial [Tegillarca granosa]